MRHRTITPMSPVAAEASPLQGYITRPQLAEHYKVAEITIALWQRRDGLPYARVGVQPLYKLDDVAKWFAARPNRMRGGRRVA
jgi:hypothetical protein